MRLGNSLTRPSKSEQLLKSPEPRAKLVTKGYKVSDTSFILKAITQLFLGECIPMVSNF